MARYTLTLTCLLLALAIQAAEAPRDRFGVRQLYSSAANGRAWAASWDNGHARTFTNAIDPDDPWYDADHGEGRYEVDGHGHLTATGDYVRMYVHDPAHKVEWSENLEVTVYVTRLSERKTVSYSGLQVFARTNHGTVGNENSNLCDDRGYGAKLMLDGRWEFEKETCHHVDHGYTSAASVKPWAELPKERTVGLKYVLRNCDGGRHVRLELWRDLTGGKDGGTWEKVTEFTDTGANFGVGGAPAKQGIRPELPLVRPLVLPDSESGQPMLTVYFRHEYGTMRYERASVREIEALP